MNYLMTHEFPSTIEASRIEWSALRNYIPCLAHIIQLVLGSFISSLGVKGHTKSWEAHQCIQQFGENENLDIGKSQRLPKKGDVRINRVSAMRPGLVIINEKVHMSTYFESPQTDLHIAKNDSYIDYTDTLLSKPVHSASKMQSVSCTTTC